MGNPDRLSHLLAGHHPPTDHVAHLPQPEQAATQLHQQATTEQDWRYQLLNSYQRGLPVVPKPFLVIANELGVQESDVLDTLHGWLDQRVVSRVGAVFQPNTVGFSTLAALAVPPEDLPEIAQKISAYAEVNHNYAREHAFNLWFVITTSTEQQREAVLASIRQTIGLPLISLPLVSDYHIDLGFDLRDGSCPRRHVPAQRLQPTPQQRTLLKQLAQGLPPVSRPFAELADRIEQTEAWVMQQLNSWCDMGAIRRLGLILRHRELGYTANAMVVWDVPDEQVDAIGHKLAGQAGITLCYRRQRSLPDWSYNLFCMIHGKHRQAVEANIALLTRQLQLGAYRQAVLFSTQRYKQCGANYG
ncbi:DNA-binding Lrp family transcriptional regulator [Chitinivorax tropicus]|uniref:siroheme decarboxylase n=1 Tax=Chitinivorax tropicus TaxID=714531 RepID=A0A840MN20_9PROT|nr:Lrp/AsnC family transcriptional regulator [Chitinivorax tropicus]MBB5018142.1 DNA-binding Lrp family transcriptional regulator [Chitinivorax tropicus]